jgi:predicted RND superfamily exporter protein
VGRFLEALARAVIRAPERTVALTVIPCLLLSIGIALVPTDLGLMSLLPKDEPEVVRFLETTAALKLGQRMIAVVEGPEESLDAAAAGLKQTLEALPGVERVFSELPTEWLEAQKPYLVPRDVFDAWTDIARNPLDVDALNRVRVGLADLDAERSRFGRDGLRLIEVSLLVDPLQAPMGGADYFFAAQAAGSVAEEHGVTIEFAGMPAVSAQDQQQVLSKIFWVTPIGFLIVLLLLRLVERRPLQLAAVALPMVLAAAGTVGAVGMILGSISAMEAFFGVLVFGLGVDFAIHQMVRLREERAGGASFEDALAATLAGAGPGIVAGGLTTAGAFAILSLAPDPGAHHLGVSGAFGLSLCLILMLTLLPALWVLLERRGSVSEPTELTIPGLPRAAALAVRKPWYVIAVALVLAAVALVGVRDFHFQTDLQKVFSRDVPALQTADRLAAEFDINPQPWVTIVDTLEEARRIAKAFEADPTFVRAESLADLFPADLDERAEVLRNLRSFVPIPDLTAAAKAGPPTIDALPELLRDRYIAPDGRFVVRTYAAKASMDGLVAIAERKAAEAIAPGTTGFGVAFEYLLGSERPWLWPILLGILAFVLLLLAVDLRSVRWVFIAATPVVFGTAMCFGILCWMGVSFNVLTTVVVPLLIGLGVDDGIHVVHRIRESLSPEIAAVSVGRAITMTTATTSTSTLAFLISDHPGMESLALVLIIGLPLCLVASVMLVPALATVTASRTPA